jgi:hypothetical protein
MYYNENYENALIYDYSSILLLDFSNYGNLKILS